MTPIRASIAVTLVATAALLANAQQQTYSSPDHQFKALVYTTDGESRVSVVTARGSHLATCAFTSDDGQHGYGVDAAYWTPNSLYFVFRLRSSGGHSPMFAPIVFWKAKSTSFYSLKDFIGDIAFGVDSPDLVKASHYPAMTDATIALHTLTPADLEEIHR
jgi:hypothetical protein